MSVCMCVWGGSGGGGGGGGVAYCITILFDPYRSQVLVNFFFLFFTSQSAIFQSCRDGSSWV